MQASKTECTLKLFYVCPHKKILKLITYSFYFDVVDAILKLCMRFSIFCQTLEQMLQTKNMTTNEHEKTVARWKAISFS